jgi:hypothetical protein
MLTIRRRLRGFRSSIADRVKHGLVSTNPDERYARGGASAYLLPIR